MMAEGYIGRKGDRSATWFVPKSRKLRFVVGGARLIRRATDDEVSLWIQAGSPPSPVLLSRLATLAALQAIPPEAVAATSVTSTASLSSEPFVLHVAAPDPALPVKRPRVVRK